MVRVGQCPGRVLAGGKRPREEAERPREPFVWALLSGVAVCLWRWVDGGAEYTVL